MESRENMPAVTFPLLAALEGCGGGAPQVNREEFPAAGTGLEAWAVTGRERLSGSL